MEQRGKALARRAISIWPHLVVDTALIEAAEMRLLAKQQDTGKVPMSEAARRLFDLLRAKVLDLDADIIELAEQVLPRKNRITLLLALDFNEIDDAAGIANDASQHKFFVNAVYNGGVYVPIREGEDIERALPIIRQARETMRA
jgi:predicted transport protein